MKNSDEIPKRKEETPMGESRPKSNQTEPSGKQRAQSDYQNIRMLMKEIYGDEKDEGYNPLPQGQHHWHMDPDNPPLQRFWGWLIANTIAMGHRTAHATSKREWDERRQQWKEGIELHVEHFADQAKDRYGQPMDPNNARRTVRQAVQRGWCRWGTPQEGERRIYLTGRVPKFGAPDKIVCTDYFPGAILKQLKDWSVEDQLKLRNAWDAEIELQGHVQAALVAANRAVFIERQDSILRGFGLDPIHQEHKKKEETPEDAEARRARIEPIRAPIQKYVQTISDSVQKAPKPPRRTASTLLPIQSNFRGETSRSVESSTVAGPKKPQDGTKPTPYKQLPAPQPAPLTTEEKQVEQLIYSEIKRLQTKRFAHMDWSKEVINPNRKSDQLFAHRVMATVGPEYVPQFLETLEAQLSRLDKNRLGKFPGRSPAPRSLGLVLQWASEYAQSLDEAAQLAVAKKEEWNRREIAACLEIIADKTETAEAKYTANQILEGHRKREVA